MKTKHRWTSPVAMGVAILLGVGILVARDPVGAQPEELVVTVFGGLMINDTTGTARPSRPSSAHRRPYRDCMAVTA